MHLAGRAYEIGYTVLVECTVMELAK